MPINVSFDAPPTPPSSTDKTNFRLRYDAFLAYIQSIGTKLINFVTQINDLEANVNAKEESAVAASNIAVALTNYKGIFIQGTSSALIGESWGYGVFFYKCSVNTSNNPILEPASWTPLSVGAQIYSATSKTPPVDADLMGIVDSSASNVLKKLSFANLWAWIVTKSASAFLSTPSSAPTTNYQVANKKYVDDIFSGNPSISVYRSGSTQAVSNGTATKVQFNSKEFDTTNAYDNSTNFRFTPQKAGRYRINATILFATLTTDTSQLYVYKNGIPYKKGASVKNNVYAVSVDCKVDMNGSTDYIEIYVNHTGGTGVYFGSELSYFQADLIIGA